MKISVLGAGNGGICSAADLKRKGHQVTLFDVPQFRRNLDSIIENNNLITVQEPDESQWQAQFDLITDNIEEALAGAEIVVLSVPATALEIFAKLAAPYLQEGMFVLIHGGSCMSSRLFSETARKAGCKTGYDIGETNTLCYAVRSDPGTCVNGQCYRAIP